MAAFKDKVGNRYGNLTVVSRLAGYKRTHWNCLCECGNKTIVSGANLGRSTLSCGCLWKKVVKKEMIGKRFGMLIIISDADGVSYGKSKFAKYKCLCDCGKEIITLGMSLRNGDTKSCGCMLIESGRINGLSTFKDLSGQKYGKLTVIGRHSKEGLNKNVKFSCRCDCGNLTIVAGNSMVCGNTTSCGCADSGSRDISTRRKACINSLRRRARDHGVYMPYNKELLILVEEEAVDSCIFLRESTGRNWEVDHIVPLKGLKDKNGDRLVTGLHNEFNLQIMLGKENSSKNNRYWPNMPTGD